MNCILLRFFQNNSMSKAGLSSIDERKIDFTLFRLLINSLIILAQFFDIIHFAKLISVIPSWYMYDILPKQSQLGILTDITWTGVDVLNKLVVLTGYDWKQLVVWHGLVSSFNSIFEKNCVLIIFEIRRYDLFLKFTYQMIYSFYWC